MTDIVVGAFKGSENNPHLNGEQPQRTVDPGVVALCREFLERAERGELTWVGIAYVGPEKISRACFYMDIDDPQIVSAALGATGFLHTTFANASMDGAENAPDPEVA